MADGKKTWLSILIATVIIVGIFGVALVGGAAYWFYRHVNARVASSESAADEFSRERTRFVGQQPLIEVRRGEEPIIHRPVGAAQTGQTELKMLHALVYDPVASKLVRVTLPFWLFRLGRTNVLSSAGFNSKGLRLSAEDLERRGPGLVLDFTEQDLDEHGRPEAQILVWTD